MHVQPSQDAIRARRAYQRRRAGLIVLPIAVDQTALVEALIEARLLDPNRADDRTALTQATARFLEICCKEKSL